MHATLHLTNKATANQAASLRLVSGGLLVFGILLCVMNLPAAEPPAVSLRRPIALAVMNDNQKLLVANRAAGSISVVDLATRQVVSETVVGKQLSDLAVLPDGKHALATDDAQQRLLWLEVNSAEVKLLSSVAVSPYPVAVIVNQAATRAYVTSQWSRRLTEIQLSADQPPQVLRTLDLPFAPRKLVLAANPAKETSGSESGPESWLILGDAFGGQLGLVSVADWKLVRQRDFPAHNLRGLATRADGKKLLVVHQMLNDAAQTTRTDVHWGLVMSNDLRWLKLESVLASDATEIYAGSHMQPLGEAGRGAADPGGIAVTANGLVVVGLGGANEIAVGQEEDYNLFRIPVGRLPKAVAATTDGKFAFAANYGDDSISIVEIEQREAVATISLGPTPALLLAETGELLFNDGALSHDRWMTCASCHIDGHTNGQLNDNLSDHSFGAAKRVLSLLGAKQTAPFAWNGESKDLPTQVRSSIENTMQSEREATPLQVSAIAAYLETLSLPPPVSQLRGEKLSAELQAAVQRGQAVFEKQACNECHSGPTYTSANTYDVGLVDEKGNRQFNPPSLLGLSHRDAFLHDGRAKSLSDLFLKHNHPRDAKYDPQEVQDLVEFLQRL